MKKFHFALIILFLLGCQPSYVTKRNVKNYDYVIVEADNSYRLSMAHLYDYLYESNLLKNGGILDTNIIRNFLDSIVCDTLSSLAASEIRLENHYDEYRLYKLRFYEFLIRAYFEETVYKKVSVDSLEIVEFYHNHPELFSLDEQLNLYHILISSKGLQYGPDSAKYNMLSDEELSLALEEYANMVYSKINNQKSFEEAAQKYSHDTLTGQNGGFVGWTTRGVYLDPFDSIAFSLRKGDIPKPYQDRDGWHIIYCEDYFAEGIPPLNPSLYIAAERTFRNIMTNKTGRKLVDSLFSNINVEYNEQLLDSNLYSIDKREWVAIINGKDTIDCNESRTLELKAREKYNVSSTTPEMKKEMLKPLYERYTIIQAARHDRIDTLSSVMLEENRFRNKYSKIIIGKDRYDYIWTPSDSLIEEYYNRHIESFAVDNPLVVQHIIVQDSILGEFLRDQAMSGIDFLELAQEYYPGEESIRKDLANLGEISEEDVSQEFFETAMRVPEGDVSHPVKTDFGYHIIKVLERRETMRMDRASHIIIPILKQQHQRYIFERFKDRLYHQFNVRFSGKLYRVHLKPLSLRK